MVSSQKLRANRLNSLKSTGPRTAAGKAASRANAARHGLLAKLPVLAALGETPAAWAAHRQAVLTDLGPTGAVEVALAERVALILWRMVRAAKADAAAAAVALRPAAALGAPPTDEDPPDRETTQLADIRRRLVEARERAAAAGRAAELFGRLADAPDGELIDPAAAEAAWAAACRALRLDPECSGPGLALRLLERERVAGPAIALELRFHGWTVARLRAGVAMLTEGRRFTVAELESMTRQWLLYAAAEQERWAQRLEADAARLEGDLAAAPVGSALERLARGPELLELVTRYERGLSVELARTLTLFHALRATCPALAAEEFDGG